MTSRDRQFDYNEADRVASEVAQSLLNDPGEFMVQALGRTPEALLRRALMIDYAQKNRPLPQRGSHEHAAADVAKNFMINLAAIKANNSIRPQ